MEPVKLKTFLFTKEKFDEIKKELKEVESSRESAVAELSAARSLGDLSENGRYKAARQKLSAIDSKIRRLKIWILNARIIRNQPGNTVKLGNIVKVKVKGREMEFRMVGELEADPKKGFLSNKSPIGKALLHNKVGSTVKISVPAGIVEYEILEIK